MSTVFFKAPFSSMHFRARLVTAHQLCTAMLHIPPQRPVLIVDVILDRLGGGFLALHEWCGVMTLFVTACLPSKKGRSVLAERLPVERSMQAGGLHHLWALHHRPFYACIDQTGDGLFAAVCHTEGSCSVYFCHRFDSCGGFYPP